MSLLSLNDGCIREILSHLDTYPHIYSVALTCKRLHRLAKESRPWLIVIHNQFHIPGSPLYAVNSAFNCSEQGLLSNSQANNVSKDEISVRNHLLPLCPVQQVLIGVELKQALGQCPHHSLYHEGRLPRQLCNDLSRLYGLSHSDYMISIGNQMTRHDVVTEKQGRFPGYTYNNAFRDRALNNSHPMTSNDISTFPYFPNNNCNYNAGYNHVSSSPASPRQGLFVFPSISHALRSSRPGDKIWILPRHWTPVPLWSRNAVTSHDPNANEARMERDRGLPSHAPNQKITKWHEVTNAVTVRWPLELIGCGRRVDDTRVLAAEGTECVFRIRNRVRIQNLTLHATMYPVIRHISGHAYIDRCNLTSQDRKLGFLVSPITVGLATPRETVIMTAARRCAIQKEEAEVAAAAGVAVGVGIDVLGRFITGAMEENAWNNGDKTNGASYDSHLDSDSVSGLSSWIWIEKEESDRTIRCGFGFYDCGEGWRKGGWKGELIGIADAAGAKGIKNAKRSLDPNDLEDSDDEEKEGSTWSGCLEITESRISGGARAVTCLDEGINVENVRLVYGMTGGGRQGSTPLYWVDVKRGARKGMEEGGELKEWMEGGKQREGRDLNLGGMAKASSEDLIDLSESSKRLRASASPSAALMLLSSSLAKAATAAGVISEEEEKKVKNEEEGGRGDKVEEEKTRCALKRMGRGEGLKSLCFPKLPPSNLVRGTKKRKFEDLLDLGDLSDVTYEEEEEGEGRQGEEKVHSNHCDGDIDGEEEEEEEVEEDDEEEGFRDGIRNSKRSVPYKIRRMTESFFNSQPKRQSDLM